MHPQARLSSWIDAYPRALWLLAFGSFLNSTGLSFIWPLTTVYIHDHLGYPMTVAGVVLLFHSGGAALGQLVGGWLYDRIGARPVMLASLFASALFTALLGVYESWTLYVTVMILFGFSASLPGPPINALVARAWPGGGRRAFNFAYVANNIGVAVGTALGGLLADRSFALAFLGAAALFLLFALFAMATIREERIDPAEAADQSPATGAEREERVPWLPIGALFIAYLCLWLIYVQWQVAGSVYMKAIGYDLSAYSILWTLNGILIFVGQPLLALTVRRVRRATAQMALGTLLYAVAFGLLLTSTQYGIFVASMVVLTFGEMLLWPVIPATVARLSTPSRRGTLQGLILSAATFGRMLGPLLGGLLYDNVGFATLIAVMASGLAIPFLSILLYARTRPQTMTADGD